MCERRLVFKLSKNIFVKFSVIVSELVGYFQDSVTTSQPAYVSLFSIFDLPFQIGSFLFLFCKNIADHEPLLKTRFSLFLTQLGLRTFFISVSNFMPKIR